MRRPRRESMRLLPALIVLLCIAGTIASSTAQDNPIIWLLKVATPAAPLKPGDRFTAEVIAQIDAGWHLYSTDQQPGGPVPTRITIPAGQPFKLAGAVGSPPTQSAVDENFGITVEYFEGVAVFVLPVVVAKDAPAGKQVLRVNVQFQTCNDRFCLPATSHKLESIIQVAAAQTSEDAAGKAADERAASEVSAAGQSKPNTDPTPAGQLNSPGSGNTSASELKSPDPGQLPAIAGSIASQAPMSNGFDSSQSLLSFIWLAVTVGALSLLTPCVFPMVPITVSYFTNHSASSRLTAVRNAGVYSAGIILTFTALGMVLALLVGAAGINQFASSPWINLLITGIFIAFALNLFGAFQISIPAGLLTRLDALTRREGGSQVIGLLLTGLVFTLTSFTCTAPFIGTLLVMAAQGSWKWPLIGMLTFSSVFALPFFALALAPQLVAQLPRSGSWLNSIKVAMGFLEIAAAMKFISNVDLVWHWGVFTREVVLASWVAVMLLMTFYLLGKFSLTHDSPVERIGAVRVVTAIASLALGLYLLTGLFGRRMGEIESFLPPATEGSFVAETAGGSGELPWIMNDYHGALELARNENKLLLIDFTGYTCTNCRWMEANMFPREDVKRELQKYVRVRLYTDGEGATYQYQQKLEQTKFGTVALPYYAILDGEANPVATFPGLTRNTAEFVRFLRTPFELKPSETRID